MSGSNAGSPTVTVKPAFSSASTASSCRLTAHVGHGQRVGDLQRDLGAPGHVVPAAGRRAQHRPGFGDGSNVCCARPEGETRDHQLVLGVLRGLAGDIRELRRAPARPESTRVTRRADRQRGPGGGVGPDHGADRHGVVECRCRRRRRPSGRPRSAPLPRPPGRCRPRSPAPRAGRSTPAGRPRSRAAAGAGVRIGLATTTRRAPSLWCSVVTRGTSPASRISVLGLRLGEPDCGGCGRPPAAEPPAAGGGAEAEQQHHQDRDQPAGAGAAAARPWRQRARLRRRAGCGTGRRRAGPSGRRWRAGRRYRRRWRPAPGCRRARPPRGRAGGHGCRRGSAPGGGAGPGTGTRRSPSWDADPDQRRQEGGGVPRSGAGSRRVAATIRSSSASGVPGALLDGARDVGVHVLVGHRHRVVAGERRLAGEHLVGHRRRRRRRRSAGVGGAGGDLLRGQVGDGAEDDVAGGHGLRADRADQAEVGDLHRALRRRSARSPA